MAYSSRLALALLACTALVPVAASAATKTAAAPAQVKPLEGLKYRLVGPFRGGRATGVAGVPGDPTTFYFGAAAFDRQLVDDGAADCPARAVLAIDAGVDVQDGHYCLLGMDLLPRHPK